MYPKPRNLTWRPPPSSVPNPSYGLYKRHTIPSARPKASLVTSPATQTYRRVGFKLVRLPNSSITPSTTATTATTKSATVATPNNVKYRSTKSKLVRLFNTPKPVRSSPQYVRRGAKLIRVDSQTGIPLTQQKRSPFQRKVANKILTPRKPSPHLKLNNLSTKITNDSNFILRRGRNLTLLNTAAVKKSVKFSPKPTKTTLLAKRSNQASSSSGRSLFRTPISSPVVKRKVSNDGKQYCLFYNRFGKCNKGDSCSYLHDSTKVAVCTKFLKGRCFDEKCLFSHHIEQGKMPACSYFLLGTCTNANCPYSHVKVSPDAPVCRDFLKGYCPRGNACTERHVIECADFASTGKCPHGDRCKLPHVTKAAAKDQAPQPPKHPPRRRLAANLDSRKRQKVRQLAIEPDLDTNGIPSVLWLGSADHEEEDYQPGLFVHDGGSTHVPVIDNDDHEESLEIHPRLSFFDD